MPRRDSTYAASVASEDLSDYDVISSAGLRSLESSVDDLTLAQRVADGAAPSEPSPAQTAREKFATTNLKPEDVQAYVQKALERAGLGERKEIWERRTVRVYVDGLFDVFHAGYVPSLSFGLTDPLYAQSGMRYSFVKPSSPSYPSDFSSASFQTKPPQKAPYPHSHTSSAASSYGTAAGLTKSSRTLL